MAEQMANGLRRQSFGKIQIRKLQRKVWRKRRVPRSGEGLNHQRLPPGGVTEVHNHPGPRTASNRGGFAQVRVGQLRKLSCKESGSASCEQKVLVRCGDRVKPCPSALPLIQGRARSVCCVAHVLATCVRMKCNRSMIGASEKRNRSNCVSA